MLTSPFIFKVSIILIIINFIGFIICGLDKRRAVKRKWRIRERTLFLLASLGGSIGIYLGFIIFHHKTRQKKFMIGIPMIFLVQLILIMLTLLKLNYS